MSSQYGLELYHHGVKGQRWGVRRYRNKDGTLTTAGKAKAEAYREKELARVDRKFRTDKIDKKLAVKIDKQEVSPTERRAKKIDKLAFEACRRDGMRKIESYKVRSMSQKSLLDERKIVRGKIALDVVVSSIGTAAINLLTPLRGGYVRVTDKDLYKTNLRVDPSTQGVVINDARKRSKSYADSISRKRNS